MTAGAPVDYRFLYAAVLEQLDREDERGRALDAKLATLLAGVVAGIGFTFRAAPTREGALTSLLYVVPLALIVLAYTTRLSRTAPRPDTLAESFPVYPVTTLIGAVEAMVEVYRYDRSVHTTKATLFDVAAIVTAIVTTVVLGAQAHAALR